MTKLIEKVKNHDTHERAVMYVGKEGVRSAYLVCMDCGKVLGKLPICEALIKPKKGRKVRRCRAYVRVDLGHILYCRVHKGTWLG